MVDKSIGEFMARFPAELRANSVFIFTSDHGEYGSSHGLQGKGGTVYEEGIRVPLIAYDPTGRYFNSSTPYRDQLCSSVDLLRLIVSLGNDGSNDWMSGKYKDLYGNRNDLLNFLRDPNDPAKGYALHTTDEFVPDALNYLHAPSHVIGMITMKEGADKKKYKQKAGVYTRWEPYVPGESQAKVRYVPADPEVTQLEFYDFRTEDGKAEMDNTSTSADATAAFRDLMEGLNSKLNTDLQVTLPPEYQPAQAAAYAAVRMYELNSNNPVILTSEEENTERLAKVWAY